MGLYLCVFDENNEDICGLEVGLYKYFAEFRGLVAQYVDSGKFMSSMSTLLNHLDCDGSWNVRECRQLKAELEEIKQVFMKEPLSPQIAALKQDIFKFYGIKPKNLFECFIDSDCEFLIDRLIELCNLATKKNRPIVFQ